MPYQTLKPFLYQGVSFQSGELFLPELFNIDQRKLSMLVKNRHLSSIANATDADVQKAKARITKELAALKKGVSSKKPPVPDSPVEKVEPVENGPEKEPDGVDTVEQADAANPEREGTNVVPARDIPSVDVDAQEEEGAEEGEPSQPVPVLKSKRRS